MSLIHCSPLFHPLEPLPILGPAVARSAEKAPFASSNKNLGATGGAATSSKKGKKVATLRRPTDSPASTSLGTPTATGSPYSARQIPGMHSPSTSRPGHLSSQTSNHGMTQKPYQEVYFDSQDQGSLTFTTESQPMDDLSSSQQILDRDH